MPPRRNGKASEKTPTAAEKNLAAADESAVGGRIKRSAGAEFEHAPEHAIGAPDEPGVVWNPYAGAFVIDRDEPRGSQAEGGAGGGLQLSPEVPQGDPEKTGTENVVEQQRHVDRADTVPEQYAPGTPGVEPEHQEP